MMYDNPNYMGNQYFFRRGDYADYMSVWNEQLHQVLPYDPYGELNLSLYKITYNHIFCLIFF